jgi:tetratricopeptide (TPR) repeat protein
MRLKLLLSTIFLFGCTSLNLEELPLYYQKVSSHYEKILEKNPQNLDLRLKLAKFYYQFKDYQKAKEHLLKIKDQLKEAKILLAKTYVHLKEYTLALEIFEELKEFDDNEYLFLYAKTLEKKNLFLRAIKLYEKVKPPLKKEAQRRIKEIGIKFEEGVPLYIKKLLEEKKEFLSKIKKEEAVYLLINEKIEIKENNTSISEIHIIKKILKEKGKELGEIQISYDSTYERVELEFARTITKEGKVIYAGKKNIRDVSKYLNYPLYSNVHAFIISMPLVEVGSILEYKIKIYSSKLVNEDDFTFIYRIKESIPIVRAIFKLIVPLKREVKFKFLNQNYAQGIGLSPQIEEKENKKIICWKFENLEAFITENKMPPLSKVIPAVLISSFRDWQEIYQWWHNLFKDKLTLSKKIKNFLKELIKDCKTDLERAKKIYEFCAKDIRYVAVEYGEGGHEPHYAEEIFWNRYGDCKDQTVLLVSLLREAGLSAYPVLIPTQEVYPISEDFASLNFNHAIAVIKIDDKLVFMDPTASTTSFGDLPLSDQEREVLVFFDEGYKILTTPLIKENQVTYQTQIYLKENEDAKIQRKIITSGFFSSFQRFYFKYTHPEKIKESIERRITEISPSSRLIDYEIKNIDDFDKSPILKYSFFTKKFLTPAKDLRIMPLLKDVEIDYAYAGKEKRNFPLEFEGIFKKISKIKIFLSSNLKVKYIAPLREVKNDYFSFKREIKYEKNLIDIYTEFAIKKRFIELENYPEFKKDLEKVFYFLREKIILEKNETQEKGL